MKFVISRLSTDIKDLMEDELRDTVKVALREKVELFDKFLCIPKEDERYDGLNQHISNALKEWQEGQKSPVEISRLLAVTEQYLKALILLVDKTSHDNIINGKESFKNIIIYIDLTELKEGKYLDLIVTTWEKKEGVTLGKKFLEDDNQFRWAVAYTQRNEKAHNFRKYTTGEAIENIYSILYVLLESTWKYKSIVEEIYSKHLIYGDKDKKQYLNKIIKEFNSKNLEKTFVIMDIVKDGERNNTLSSLDIMANKKEKDNYMKLVGVAGLGKTRLMKHLQYKDAIKGDKLSVYVELKDLSSLKKSLLDLIAEASELDKESCILLMEKGDMNLYLDGINEILCSDADKKIICDDIDKLSIDYPKIQILVSDRENSSITVSGMPTYSLVDLNKELVDEFVEKNSSSKKMEEKIKGILEEDKNLYNIVKTPFMLLAFMDIVENNEYTTSINNEGRLRAKYVKSLIKRETVEKREARADKITLLLAQLYIKDKKLEENINVFKKRQILRRFKECGDYYGFSIDTVDVLELIVQMGILIKSGDEEYRFANEIYENYFKDEAFETLYDID